MKELKSVLLAVFSVVLSVAFMYLLQMFLNTSCIKLLISAISIIGFIAVIILIVQALKKENKRKFIKSQFHAVLLIFSIILIIIGTAYISIYNIAMHEVFGEDLTISEKIEKRKILKQYIKSMKEYSGDIDFYINDLNKEAIDHITIYAPKDIDQDYIDAIKDTFPLAEELVERVYGKIEKDPLKVIFYNKEDWEEIDFINTELVQGFFDGENIYLKGFLDNQLLSYIKQNFIHEYSHYAMDMYVYEHNILSSIPAWFNEGTAEYISIDKDENKFALDYIRNPIDLRELDSDTGFWASLETAIDEEEFYDPYMYSYYMIDSLVDFKGEGVISDILLKLKETDFYEAFKELTGVTIEDYQEVNLPEYVKRKINELGK